MPDISDRSDIQKIVDTFYSKVRTDDVIGFIFNDIAQVNWELHLPVMYDFWEFTVLGTGSYSGNPMTPHFALNEKIKLTSIHFNRWVELFTTTVDSLFSGPHAHELKQRAKQIAGLMEYKINDNNRLRIL